LGIQTASTLADEEEVDASALLLGKVRSVEDDAHGQTTDGTGDGDGHDPGEDEETDSLPVDGLDGAVAETDPDGGAGDAHGG
jgi:hypothetical protein